MAKMWRTCAKCTRILYGYQRWSWWKSYEILRRKWIVTEPPPHDRRTTTHNDPGHRQQTSGRSTMCKLVLPAKPGYSNLPPLTMPCGPAAAERRKKCRARTCNMFWKDEKLCWRDEGKFVKDKQLKHQNKLFQRFSSFTHNKEWRYYMTCLRDFEIFCEQWREKG